MIASTPGTPDGPCAWPWPWVCAARPAAGRRAPCGGRAAGAAPPLRSAVSATIADCTPGIALTASSARFRTGSQACTTPASTVIEKNTLPSVATMSDSVPVFGNGVPSGAATLPSAASTSSLVTGIV